MGIKSLEVTLHPQSYAEGWYQGTASDEWYYYDGEGNWYIYAAGYLYPAHLFEPAPKTVNVILGDTLRVDISFTYSGPPKTVRPYAAIGQKTLSVFDELITVTGTTISLGQSTTPQTYSRSLNLPIQSPLTAGRNYHLYAKLINGISTTYGQTITPALENAIFVVSFEPTFADFQITDFQKV